MKILCVICKKDILSGSKEIVEKNDFVYHLKCMEKTKVKTVNIIDKAKLQSIIEWAKMKKLVEQAEEDSWNLDLIQKNKKAYEND
jgi:hypothetical protein